MASHHSRTGQNRLTNADVEQDDRFDELGMRGLYESPHLESDCLATRLDNTGELMMAARAEPEYDEFGDPIEGTGGVELDAYWVGASLRTTQARDVDPMDLADEDLTGLPLEAQERLHGLREERKRQREKALAAHTMNIDRETRRRDELLAEQRDRRTDYEDRIIRPEPGMTHHDPFENLDEETAKQVRTQAARLDDRLITGPRVEVLEHRLACKVTLSQPVYTALSNLQEELYQDAGIIQPIATVPSIPSKYNVEADIQGEVTTLWQPKSGSQQQVGIIKDDTGTIKFTVWTLSNQDVILHEGDMVRIVAGKVGEYNGQATLAADSETQITILERGDGPAPRGDIPDVDWSKYAERNRERGIEQPYQNHGGRSMPGLGAPGVQDVSRPIHCPADRLDPEEGGKRDAGHWLKATEIFEDDGPVPLPQWWKEQSNVVAVTVPADADSQVIAEQIQETVAHTGLEANTGVAVPDTNSTNEARSVLADERAPTVQPDGGHSLESTTNVSVHADVGEQRQLWVLVRDESLIGSALSTPRQENQSNDLVGAANEDPTMSITATPDDDTGTSLGIPSTKAACAECENNRAHYRLVQLRSIDEPPTRLLTCTACGNRWREDS